ncbi:MAG TPA: type IV pilin protein, partial [Desulfomonilia bacterium]|nr:type IV pilin protein [Desulfomonilia bacterium]
MHNKGYTLTELMIAVAIVGILAAICIPSYTAHVKRVRRADAITALETVALYEEKNFALTNQYDTVANLAVQGLTDPDTKYYHIVAAAPAGGTFQQGFIATATPINQQASDVTVFAINSNGDRGTLGAGVVVPDSDL